MNRPFITAAILGIALLVHAVSPMQARPSDPRKGSSGAGEPVVIGVTVSLQGKYREPSSMIHSAYKLWMRQVNERGGLLGRPVRLLVRDDRSSKARVRSLYQKLLAEERVDLVLSPYGTPLTLAAAEVTEKHGAFLMACGASGEAIWEQGYKNVVGIYAPAPRYFIGFLDLLARNDFRSVAVVFEDSSFNVSAARGARDWARRFGLNVKYYRSFQGGRQALMPLVKELRKADAEGVVLSAYPPECYAFMDLLEETGYRPPALGMTITPVLPDFYERAGAMGEGVFAPSQWEPVARIPFPGTARFIEDFRQFAGKAPSYHAASAYSACRLLERAVSETQSLDHEEIRDYVFSLDTVTILGRFKVDRNGRQVGHNPILIQWQEGRKEIVYPRNMKTSEPRFRRESPQ